MPIYDFDCPQGHRFEAYCHEYTEETPCRADGCKAKAHVVFVAISGVGATDYAGSDPVVIHRAPDGSVRFPGNVNAPVPEGFERVELKTTHEKRRFEREINQNEYRKWADAQERKEKFFSEVRKQNRSELFAKMKDLPPFARDLAMAAINERNRKPSAKYEAGFAIEALSMDASNRNSCDDERGRGRK